MALRFPSPFGKSAAAQNKPEQAAPVQPPAAAKPVDPYVHGDALPVPEAIEKDSDSIWAMWTDAVNEAPAEEDAPPTELLPDLLQTTPDAKPPGAAAEGSDDRFLKTMPATLFMDLPGRLQDGK